MIGNKKTTIEIIEEDKRRYPAPPTPPPNRIIKETPEGFWFIIDLIAIILCIILVLFGFGII